MSGWQLDRPVDGISGPPIEVLEKPFDLSGLARAVDGALRLRDEP